MMSSNQRKVWRFEANTIVAYGTLSKK